MKSYTLSPSGSSKIAASLCKLCADGAIGSSLIREGCSQTAFSLFIARLAHQQLVEKGKTAEDLAVMFDMTSAANASAAKQALQDCMLTTDEETHIAVLGKNAKNKEGALNPFSVLSYWKSIGGIKAAPNLAIFD